MVTRRRFLAGTAGGLAAGGLPLIRPLAGSTGEIRLRAGPLAASEPLPFDGLLAYNGSVPGPTLRVAEGDPLAAVLENELGQNTTIHWHGVALPNAMDGVPGLTQAPVRPGERFRYGFTPPRPGTYWYHPHFSTSEQLGRGLNGLLIVTEREPPAVDHDWAWVLDDWRVDSDGAIAGFGNRHDASHGGRLGNVATLNGELDTRARARPGARLRLRLLNAANARTWWLRWRGVTPRLLAVDGEPVAPSELPDPAPLNAGNRLDLLIELPRDAGEVALEALIGESGEVVELARILVEGEAVDTAAAPLSEIAVGSPRALPARRFDDAPATNVYLTGGAMGRMPGARFGGELMGMRELVARGRFWAINGVAAGDAWPAPMLRVRHGEAHRLRLVNDSRWPHPMHLHGHHVQLLRAGRLEPFAGVLRDSVTLDAGETLEVGLVADNPGLWAMHCHIPEHAEAGMRGVLEVLPA